MTNMMSIDTSRIVALKKEKEKKKNIYIYIYVGFLREEKQGITLHFSTCDLFQFIQYLTYSLFLFFFCCFQLAMAYSRQQVIDKLKFAKFVDNLFLSFFFNLIIKFWDIIFVFWILRRDNLDFYEILFTYLFLNF